MNSERKARIGGLTFLFSGWMPEVQEQENLPRFFVTDGEPDIRIDIQSVSDIAYPVGKQPDFESPYLRCYCCGNETHRFYRRDWEETGRDYAHVIYRNDLPNVLELQICESRLSWSFQQILSCIGIEELLLRHDRAVLHSSWIEMDGKAILFSGRSGIGKSTQAALWEKFRNATVRNGDRTLLRNMDGTEYACGLPYAGASGICSNASAPIRAIVMLDQGKENRLRRLPALTSVKRLLSQMPVPKWNPEMIGRALNVASRVAETVPVYELVCLPEESAVKVLEDALG